MRRDNAEMGLLEHLGELRQRIIKAAAAVALGSVLGWIYRHEIREFVLRPLHDACLLLGQVCDVRSPGLLGGFLAYLKISLLVGLLLALPVILYQVWAFVAPGLYQRERKWAAGFCGSAFVLFSVSAFFSWRLVVPRAFLFLLDAAEGFPPLIMIDEYIGFFSGLLLAFGVAFQLPLVVAFLALIGVLDHRKLLAGWRYFAVGAFVLGAIVTPPDPVSQLLFALPLLGLYGLSIPIARVFERKRSSERPEPPSETDALLLLLISRLLLRERQDSPSLKAA